MLWFSFGERAVNRILDSDTVRGWGLSSESEKLRSWTAARLPRSSRPIGDDLLLHLWGLIAEKQIRTPQYQGYLLLGVIAQRQGLPAGLVRRLTAAILSIPSEPADRRDHQLIIATGMLAYRREQPPEVVAHLGSLMNSTHSHALGFAAAQTLGKIGARQSLDTSVLLGMGHALARTEDLALRIEIAHSLGVVSAHSELPGTAIDALEEVMTRDANPHARMAALDALTARPRNADSMLSMLRGVAGDSYERLRQSATSKALGLVASSGDDALISTFENTREPAAWRAGALRRVVQSNLDDPANVPRVLAATEDASSAVRVVGFDLLSMLQRPALGVVDSLDWTAFIERGLSDAQAPVRIAAIGSVIALPIPMNAKVRLWILGLENDDRTVQLAVMLLLRRRPIAGLVFTPLSKRDSQGAQSLASTLDSLTRHGDAQIAQSAAATLAAIRPKDDAAQGPKPPQWLGAALIIALAAVPIVLCVGFAIYFLARFITYLLARRWRALRAAGIMGLWTLLSIALGAGLSAVVLGLGHGSMSIGEGFAIVAAYAVVIGAYGGTGWLLRLAVRP